MPTRPNPGGLRLMVGNMCGSSLAMPPAFLVAQRCVYTDLCGPLWQREDFEPSLQFNAGVLSPQEQALWG